MSVDRLQKSEDVLAKADCLFTQEQVSSAISVLAYAINSELAESNPVVLSVMKGGLVFSGQLLTQLSFPLEVDYLHATRYQDDVEGHELEWIVTPTHSLAGRNVLVLDDILDVGTTLVAIKEACLAQGALSVKTAVMIDKDHDRKAVAGLKADFTALQVPDRYVFGYGMDFCGYLRNVNGIYAVQGQ